MARRDRLVVRTLRCGRSNPGSNPGPGSIILFFFFLNFYFHSIMFKKILEKCHFALQKYRLRDQGPQSTCFLLRKSYQQCCCSYYDQRCRQPLASNAFVNRTLWGRAGQRSNKNGEAATLRFFVQKRCHNGTSKLSERNTTQRLGVLSLSFCFSKRDW